MKLLRFAKIQAKDKKHSIVRCVIAQNNVLLSPRQSDFAIDDFCT